MKKTFTVSHTKNIKQMACEIIRLFSENITFLAQCGHPQAITSIIKHHLYEEKKKKKKYIDTNTKPHQNIQQMAI